MSDMDKVRRLRAELPATEHEVYLNTGSVGPMPRVAAEATKNQLELETSEGRVGGAIWQAADEARQRARAAVAGVIGADAAEIALTHFTTESINVVLWGLDWRPGDGWHAQFSLRRTVAQLDFYDFISSAEFSSDRINGGNANLLPQLTL